jgi:hypothetical protein
VINGRITRNKLVTTRKKESEILTRLSKILERFSAQSTGLVSNLQKVEYERLVSRLTNLRS